MLTFHSQIVLTDNVFRLVHHFGTEEDQLSANFAFMLTFDDSALEAFLESCHLPQEAKDIEIRAQVPYEGGTSRIDIEVRKHGSFLLFLESKIWGNPLHKGQLLKYAKILRSRKEEEDIEVRLVAVTQMDQSERFHRYSIEFPLDAGECHYLRWNDVQEMIEKSPTRGWKKGVKQMFLEYTGDKMKDRKVVSNMQVGDLDEVLVQSTTPEFWEVNRKHRFCSATMIKKDGRRASTPDPMFVAFYRTSPISAITHIAKVESIELYVPSEEAYKGTSLEEKAKEWSGVDKIYRLGRFVELARPIKGGKGKGVVMYWLTTITNLLDARVLSDLKRL